MHFNIVAVETSKDGPPRSINVIVKGKDHTEAWAKIAHNLMVRHRDRIPELENGRLKFVDDDISYTFQTFRQAALTESIYNHLLYDCAPCDQACAIAERIKHDEESHLVLRTRAQVENATGLNEGDRSCRTI